MRSSAPHSLAACLRMVVLVEALPWKHCGEGLERLAIALACRLGEHRGRVQAPAQRDPDRDVAAQPQSYGVVEQTAEGVDWIPLVVGMALRRVVPVADPARAPSRDQQVVRRLETLDAGEEGVGGVAHGSARQVVGDQGVVGPRPLVHGRQDRLDLGRENEELGVQVVVEGLGAEAVAGAEQLRER